MCRDIFDKPVCLPPGGSKNTSSKGVCYNFSFSCYCYTDHVRHWVEHYIEYALDLLNWISNQLLFCMKRFCLWLRNFTCDGARNIDLFEGYCGKRQFLSSLTQSVIFCFLSKLLIFLLFCCIGCDAKGMSPLVWVYVGAGGAVILLLLFVVCCLGYWLTKRRANTGRRMPFNDLTPSGNSHFPNRLGNVEDSYFCTFQCE